MRVSCSSTRDRGQTEPIAALVGVSVLALALSLYGVVVLDVLNQDSDRELAGPTVDGTWMELRDDGVYDDTSDEDLSEKLVVGVNDEDSRAFPSGHNIHIEVVYLDDDGEMTTVDEATFVWQGDAGAPWETVDDATPSPEADTAARPVPIELKPGEVQAGTLRVEVWQ